MRAHIRFAHHARERRLDAAAADLNAFSLGFGCRNPDVGAGFFIVGRADGIELSEFPGAAPAAFSGRCSGFSPQKPRLGKRTVVFDKHVSGLEAFTVAECNSTHFTGHFARKERLRLSGYLRAEFDRISQC